MKFIQALLFPFSILYSGITGIRNKLFDIKVLKSVAFDLPVIVVGNLRVGGTGKTPMIEYLIDLLKSDKNLAVLSRGYGRKTKGFLLADERSSPKSIGDEPSQYYVKYRNEIDVAVCEDRVLAIPTILQRSPETNTILLDDAFQHRYLKAGLNILLTTYSHPFYSDFTLPSGRLREGRKGAGRADVIIVTKCPPQLSEDERKGIIENIKRYNAFASVYFSKIAYQTPVLNSGLKPEHGAEIVAAAGLAQNEYFFNYLSDNYKVIKTYSFPDHANYTTRDVEKIAHAAREHQCPLLVTEKDYVKLSDPKFEQYLRNIDFGFIPIKVEFLQNEAAFIEQVKNFIHKFEA